VPSRTEFDESLGTMDSGEAVERLALEEYATRKLLRETKGRLLEIGAIPARSPVKIISKMQT